MNLNTWQQLTPDGSIRALKYSFGFGTANTLAVRLDDGGWLVVSPAVGIPSAALDALAADGPVTALLAPNGYHHLGQPAWRQRFPDATSYAPEGALPRLAAKAKAVPFRPLGELTAKLPARIGLLVPDGMKAPDLWVRATAADATVWFVGDLVSNTVAADVALLPRLVMQLFGGGPGLRFNPVPTMVYLKDKPAWKASVRQLLAAKPPTVVLPAHGDVVQDDAAARTLSVLA